MRTRIDSYKKEEWEQSGKSQRPRFKKVFVTECFSGSTNDSSEGIAQRSIQGLTFKSPLMYVGINEIKMSTKANSRL